jgi:site-specific recombinase XerD
MTALTPHLSAFLRDHLRHERNVSRHTVAAYATCFALLVRFAADRLKHRPTDLTIEELDLDLISAFLEHTEAERGNSARTRNGRLAAIRAFFRYVEYRVPACLDLALRVRSMPSKRTDTTLIDYLTRDEIVALLDAPDPRSRLGIRDRAMLHLAYAGGLRVAELLSLQLQDLPERSLATVHVMGKGRRERILPLWRETQAALRSWLAARPACETTEIFLNSNGQPMTRDGFAFRLAKHVATAAHKQPSLLTKRVTPHVLRHSCAMHTIAATGDIRKVALWLGHASLQSTEAYLRADPEEKLQILAAHSTPGIKAGQFKPPTDPLLSMLDDARKLT